MSATKERSGWFDDTHWHQCLNDNHPTFGILLRTVDADFEVAIQSRSSLLISAHQWRVKVLWSSTILNGWLKDLFCLDIESNSLQMDPQDFASVGSTVQYVSHRVHRIGHRQHSSIGQRDLLESILPNGI